MDETKRSRRKSKMKYYVVADIHGFYTEMIDALTKAGYFSDTEQKKIIVCGDLLDRGEEAVKVQQFVLDLMAKDEIILVRGNHEDLFLQMIDHDGGMPLYHHESNGTFDSALQLSGFGLREAYTERVDFVVKVRETPFYDKIIPAMVNYYEVGDYIFVHGWIPFHGGRQTNMPITFNPDWRTATEEQWSSARWVNGMDASRQIIVEGKTIVCGHWHCSYGHAYLEGKGSVHGNDADYTPYYGKGIIAIDACTARSGLVNCIVVEA